FTGRERSADFGVLLRRQLRVPSDDETIHGRRDVFRTVSGSERYACARQYASRGTVALCVRARDFPAGFLKEDGGCAHADARDAYEMGLHTPIVSKETPAREGRRPGHLRCVSGGARRRPDYDAATRKSYRLHQDGDTSYAQTR